jgi:hypothetical protein
LSTEQHRRFVELIVNETPPIKNYGEYKAYAVMFQASRLPEERFERILDEKQLRILRKTFRDVRGSNGSSSRRAISTRRARTGFRPPW